MTPHFPKSIMKCLRNRFYMFAILGLFLALLYFFNGLARAAPQYSNEDREYNFLNPQGVKPQVKVMPLAPRLKSIEGKTVFVNMGESEKTQAPTMPTLYKLLQKKYPKTDWRWIGAWGFGPNTPEDEVLKSAHGVIRGVAW